MKRPYLTKQNGKYEIKVRTCGGSLDLKQFTALRDIADNYGSGKIHLTVRQEVLLFDIEEDHLEEALRKLEDAGLRGGSAGFRVRNIVCCVGQRCKNSVLDVTGLAQDLDEKYGERELPGAVKIAMGSCPYPCTRPYLNDIGIIARAYPVVDLEKCEGSAKCVEACPMKAISINEDNKAVINRKKCKMCGRCINTCPLSAIYAKEKGLTVVVGGRGTWPALKGEILAEMLEPRDIVPLVGKILDYYEQNALSHEKRLRPFVKRIGIEKMRKDILDTDKPVGQRWREAML
ncbi:MAG: 4Fe-4S binding protein [Desulfobia sp.]